MADPVSGNEAPVERRDVDEATSGGAAAAFGFVLFSFVLLAYEVVQIRVFAYSLNPSFVYANIAIAMLGFGVAATVLCLSPKLRALPLPSLFAACGIGFGVSAFLANAVFARASHLLHFEASVAATFGGTTLLVVLLTMLPFAFGGLGVAAVLARNTKHVGRWYALNLAGSGFGCFTVQAALPSLGAEALLVLLAALGVVAALLFARTAPRRLRTAAAVVVAALALAAVAAPNLLPFQPDSRDQLARVAQFYRRAGAGEPVREFSRWDPVGRVEIYSWRGQFMRAPADLPFKVFTQDAGAASTLFGLGTLPGGDVRVFDDSVYGVASMLRPQSDVLIIGLGGGPDVQAALRHGARSITGVEINRTAAHIAAGPFAQFLGDPYHQPGVTIVVQDGRSYVAAATRQWDVLQMSGTDTLTVQSSGTSVLAESYLYTVEAFLDYLHVLRPDGILSILRFGIEPFRLGAIATRALLRLGVADPSDYVVVLGQGRMRLTLVKKRPWTVAELGALDAIAARSVEANAGIIFPPYDLWEYKLGAPLEVLYAPRRPDNRPGLAKVLAEAAVDGSPAARTAPTDDRPFYFAPELYNYLKGGMVAPAAGQQIATYLGFISVLLVVSLVLLLGPLVLLRRKGLRGGRSWITLAYFFLLGACYMLIEIVLLQKTVLLVEHPAYSVSVVLASLLLFSALGSWLSGRLRVAPGRLALGAVLMIVVAGAVLVFAGEQLFAALLPLPFGVRMAAVALLLAPFGTAMGTFFPSGMRRLGDDAGPLLPWAIGVNGLASVLGTTLSTPVAMLTGFRVLLVIAVAGYVLAGLAFRGLEGRKGEGS